MTIMAERPLTLPTRRPDTDLTADVEARKNTLYPADIQQAARTHKMQLLNSTSANEITWNPADPAEVAEVARLFAEQKETGALAYTTDARGGGATQLREFDPTAERILFAPQLQGG